MLCRGCRQDVKDIQASRRITRLSSVHPGRTIAPLTRRANMPASLRNGPALVDVHGPAATIRLNRPEKLNALDNALIDRVLQLLDFVESEPAIRAVILTGAGQRAFSAGADIAELREIIASGGDVAIRNFVRRGQGLTRRIAGFPKPVIAAVNGLAYGGGCEVVEACHLAVAAEHAAFAKPEIKLGFPPPFGGTQRLARLIGRRRALRMILTGETISAQEAQRIGLVNEIVAAADLLATAAALAERIALHTPAAVTACLRSVLDGIEVPIDQGLALEATHFMQLAGTTDVEVRLRNFVQRAQ
jgi:enoyl-CoA hydratase/carnithine racemase